MRQLNLRYEFAVWSLLLAGLILVSVGPGCAESLDEWSDSAGTDGFVVAQEFDSGIPEPVRRRGGVRHDSSGESVGLQNQYPQIDSKPVEGHAMGREAQRSSRHGQRRRARVGGRELYGGSLDLRPLSLSEAQKEKIRSIRSESRMKAREYRKALKVKKFAMQDMMFSPDATPVQIRTAAKDFQYAQANMQDTILGDFLGVRAVLTQEQLKMLPEIKPQRQRMGADRSRRPPPGMSGRTYRQPGTQGNPGNPDFTGWPPGSQGGGASPMPGLRGGPGGMGGPGRRWGGGFRGEPPPWRRSGFDGQFPGGKQSDPGN